MNKGMKLRKTRCYSIQ